MNDMNVNREIDPTGKIDDMNFTEIVERDRNKRQNESHRYVSTEESNKMNRTDVIDPIRARYQMNLNGVTDAIGAVTG